MTTTARSVTWSFPASTANGSSRRQLFCDVISTRRWLPPRSDGWGRPREADLPQLQAHIRKTRSRGRGSDHLALPPSRPLVAQGDDRHLWPLGACGAELQAAKMEGAFPV